MKKIIAGIAIGVLFVLAGCKSQTDFISECDRANGFVTAKDYTWVTMVGKTVIVHNGTRFTCHYPDGTVSHFDSDES